jgi:hypothetical protein
LAAVPNGCPRFNELAIVSDGDLERLLFCGAEGPVDLRFSKDPVFIRTLGNRPFAYANS